MAEVNKEQKKEYQSVISIIDDLAKRRSKRIISTTVRSGRRADVITTGKRGRYVRYRLPQDEGVTDIAIAPTIKAAILRSRGHAIKIRREDYREKVRRKKISTLICIVFDTSSSMIKEGKITVAKSILDEVLMDAYQKRDRISLVTYAGQHAEVVLPFTSSIELAKPYLEKMPFGGTTPLASGIITGLGTMKVKLTAEPESIPIMVVVTDGTANTPMSPGADIHRELVEVCLTVKKNRLNVLVIDVSKDGSDLAKETADLMGGRYFFAGSLLESKEFTDLVEQEMIKRAFYINIINPTIGGILIHGMSDESIENALDDLQEMTPEIEVVNGCRFSCDPDKPRELCWECREKALAGTIRSTLRPLEIVRTTADIDDDELRGYFDFDKAKEGDLYEAFVPGILAEVNRGILFIKDIDKLPDEIVDPLSDAAASGTNVVKFDVDSISHPCRITIVGSMSAEGGDLHPQLYNQITMLIDAKKIRDMERRIKVLKQRKEFDIDSVKFKDRQERENQDIKTQIMKARNELVSVVTSESLLDIISRICLDYNVAGHIPDILVEKTARTIAAFEGRSQVVEEDVLEASEMVLPLSMESRSYAEDYGLEKIKEMVRTYE